MKFWVLFQHLLEELVQVRANIVDLTIVGVHVERLGIVGGGAKELDDARFLVQDGLDAVL